jgi:hypothetical protein
MVKDVTDRQADGRNFAVTAGGANCSLDCGEELTREFYDIKFRSNAIRRPSDLFAE